MKPVRGNYIFKNKILIGLVWVLMLLLLKTEEECEKRRGIFFKLVDRFYL